MNQPGRPSTRLAPREIFDLVYRCCRVADIDAGNAERCGRNVTHAELHRQRGVEAFVHAASAGTSALTGFALAPTMVDAAIVDAAMAESASTTAVFTEPIALAAVSEALWQAALRGRVATTVDDTSSAVDMVESIEFEASEVTDDRRSAAAERDRRAMQDGVLVDTHLLNELAAKAATFLIAEHIIDAADEPTV